MPWSANRDLLQPVKTRDLPTVASGSVQSGLSRSDDDLSIVTPTILYALLHVWTR